MLFETEQDVNNEKNAMNEFLKKMVNPKVKAFKLPQQSLDFMIYDDKKIIAFIEIKCFKTAWKKYDNIIVAVRKIKKMKVFNHIAPTYFLVRHSDNIITYQNVNKLQGEIKWFSRKNQREGAVNDSEDVMFVPTELWNVLKID